MASYNEPTPVLSTSTSSSNPPQIRPPGENDVIVGIGCNKHCGNVKFSQFIKAYKRTRFRTNPSIETKEAVKEVVQFWRKLSPRGRFLAQKSRNNCGEWHEVEDKQAMRIAAFFLLNGAANGGDKMLKRQKSTDAIRENRNAAGAACNNNNSNNLKQCRQQGLSQGKPQLEQQRQQQNQQKMPSQGFQFQGSFQGQGQLHFQGQVGQMSQQQASQQLSSQQRGQIAQAQTYQNNQVTQFPQQDDWAASLEPVPIGPTSKTSMGWNGMKNNESQQQTQLPQVQGSVGNMQNFQDPVKPQPQVHGSMQNYQQLQEPVKQQSQLLQGNMQNYQQPEPVKQQSHLDFGSDGFDFDPIPLKFNDDDFDPLPLPANNSTNNQFSNAPPAGPEQVQVSVNMVVNTMPQGYARDSNAAVNTVTNIQIGTGTINDDRNLPNSTPAINDNSYQPNGFIQISTQSNPNSQGGTMQNGMNSNYSAFNSSNGNRPHQMNDFQIGFFGNSDENESSDMPGQSGSNSGYNHCNDGFAGSNNGIFMQQQQNSGYNGYNNMGMNNGNIMNGNGGNVNSGNVGQDNNDGGNRWNKNKVASAVPCAAQLADIFDDW